MSMILVASIDNAIFRLEKLEEFVEKSLWRGAGKQLLFLRIFTSFLSCDVVLLSDVCIFLFKRSRGSTKTKLKFVSGNSNKKGMSH